MDRPSINRCEMPSGIEEMSAWRPDDMREFLDNLLPIPETRFKKLIGLIKDHTGEYSEDDTNIQNQIRLAQLQANDSVPEAKYSLDGSIEEYDLFTLAVDRFIYKKKFDLEKEGEAIEILLQRLHEGERQLRSRHFSGREAFEKLAFDAEIAQFYATIDHAYDNLKHASDRYCYFIQNLFNKIGNNTSWEHKSLLEKPLNHSDLIELWSMMESSIRSAFIQWAYNWAKVHIKMAKRIDIMKQKGVSISKFFENIREFLLFCTTDGKSHYAAWAWATMAEVILKLENESPKYPELKKCLQTKDWSNLSADDCMTKAFETNPDDTKVIFCVGKHFRVSNHLRDNIEKSVEILTYLIQLQPENHSAFHNLGLAHRALWIIDRDYPEAIIYLRKKEEQGPNYIELHSANPIEEESPDNHHLNAYYEMMLRACEITKFAVALYLIDLARACISLKRYDEAERHFVKASGLEFGEAKWYNESFLFEQWGLFLYKQGDFSRAKAVFHRACDICFRQYIRPRLALDNLLKILADEEREADKTTRRNIAEERQMLLRQTTSVQERQKLLNKKNPYNQ